MYYAKNRLIYIQILFPQSKKIIERSLVKSFYVDLPAQAPMQLLISNTTNKQVLATYVLK